MRVPIWLAVLWGPLHVLVGVMVYRAGREGWFVRDSREGHERLASANNEGAES